MNTLMQSFRSSRKHNFVYILIFILILLNALLIDHWLSIRIRPNRNVLAIGSQSSLAFDESIEVTLQPPVELDYMTRIQVLELRQLAVNRYPELFAGPYKPSDAVFKQIEDGRPWWGIPGEFYYGPGQQSIAGVSEESRFILNPFLLAAAEFYDSTGVFTNGLWNWDRAHITAEDLNKSDFPFYCQPDRLQWQPRNSFALLTYNVTECLALLNRWTLQRITMDNVGFEITAYNARDMNLNYIQLVHAESQNIKLSKPFDAPISEPEFIHRGESCQYPGGCNNASPYVPQLSFISLDALPARLVIYFWSKEPGPESLMSPDMKFVLQFK